MQIAHVRDMCINRRPKIVKIREMPRVIMCEWFEHISHQ